MIPDTLSEMVSATLHRLLLLCPLESLLWSVSHGPQSFELVLAPVWVTQGLQTLGDGHAFGWSFPLSSLLWLPVSFSHVWIEGSSAPLDGILAHDGIVWIHSVFFHHILLIYFRAGWNHPHVAGHNLTTANGCCFQTATSAHCR